MKSWIVSLFCYIAVYIQLMIMIFYYYGSHFMMEETAGATVDILYYIAVYAWFAGCSVFAVRTHETTEREAFYAARQQELEIKEWKKLLGDIPEPVVFTHKGEINFFNKATLELLKIPQTPESPIETQKEQLIIELSQLKQKGNKQSLKEIMDTRAFSGLNNETLFVHRKGSTKRLLTIKCVQSGSSNEEGVVEYIFHDVTALKALEHNKAKEQCFDLLLATASHDIRTPLNVMLGVIDVLADYVTTFAGREQINVARSCGQRMLHYIKGLTFIRQINIGNVLVTKRLFNPTEIAKNVLNTIEFSAQSKNLRLESSVDSFVPSTLCSDKEMYAIILQNLLENAIKYTFTGGVKVSLKYDPSDHLLTTSVIDTGIGMTEEQQQNVGVLFLKSRSQCSLNPQGLGLGLFLAKTLSHQLDGRLTVESIANFGTTARFAITCFPSEDACSERQLIEPYSSVTLSQAPESFACPCSKILLVDDEPFNLLVLSAYLASINVKADKAENGRIALDLIERKRDCGECCNGYAVIFMDINMPVMDGIEATTKICEMVKMGKIPQCDIVAVTAAAGLDNPTIYASYVAKGFTELCKAYEYNAVVSKPVQKTDFLHILKKYI